MDYNGSNNDDSIVYSSEDSDSDDDENHYNRNFIVLNNHIRINNYTSESIYVWTLLDELELFIDRLGYLYSNMSNAILAFLPTLLEENNIDY